MHRLPDPHSELKWDCSDFSRGDQYESKKGAAIMTGHLVTLKVSANVPKDCSFWPDDDSWNGVCEELSLTVRGSSFEDAKRKMEAALQAYIECVLHEHPRASRKKIA
jgi:predicted RNase H-like HicB family nuclease